MLIASRAGVSCWSACRASHANIEKSPDEPHEPSLAARVGQLPLKFGLPNATRTLHGVLALLMVAFIQALPR